MCRFKVEILIDEEKVIKDDKYEPKDMYDCIRKMFKRFDLPEIKTDEPYHFIFTDKGGKKDLGGLGAAVMDLYNSDWFRRYAERFLWYERENKEFYKEDIFKELDDFEVKRDLSSLQTNSIPNVNPHEITIRADKKEDGKMYRFKVEILIDEENVIKDDKYEPQDMYDCIRKMFKRFDLPEIKTDEPYHFIFTDKGGSKDMGGLASAAIDLYETDWFKKYAVEFYWYSRNSDNTVSKRSIFDELNGFKVKGI